MNKLITKKINHINKLNFMWEVIYKTLKDLEQFIEKITNSEIQKEYIKKAFYEMITTLDEQCTSANYTILGENIDNE